MDYSKYSIFLEVAKSNSISKAAETLGYTQSGISHTLKRMEEEFKLPLFYRNRNGAFLTPSGEALLPYITQLVQSESNLNQMILSLHDLQKGTLSIGTYSSISRNWLPEILRRFKTDYPSIKIHFKEGGNKDILNWLENHEVDLAFISSNPNQKHMEWIPLMEDPLMAVLPKGYPHDGSTPFPVKNYNGQTFIISALGTDVDVHRLLQQQHISPDIQYSAKDDYTIISMVAHHLGISILPDLVLRHYGDSVKILPLDPPYNRELGIVVPKLSLESPVTSRFIEYTKQYIKERL